MTEREFCRDLKLTWQAFGLETPDLLEQRGIEVQGLFGNLSDIIDISSKFLENLTEDPENIGKNFCNHSESMKKVYTDYCINHDKAEQLLEKYEAMPDVQKMLQKSVETLQAQVVCFNMGSILIKPVQRILKYPLILNELLKVQIHTFRNLHFLSKNSTLISRENCRFFWGGEKLVKMLWFWTF